MEFQRSYFALHLAFARRVAELQGIALDDAMLRYTPWYNHGLRLGKEPDANHPGWLAFLDAVHDGAAPVEHLYEASRTAPPYPDSVPDLCFYGDYWPEHRTAGVHFVNNAPGGIALQRSEVFKRVAELRAIFTTVAREHPEAERVGGGSWLYNVEAYRRLFPPAYVATRRPADRIHYGFMGAWGQFLDRHFAVKPQVRDPFLAGIAAARTMAEVEACFPYRQMIVGGDIEMFYRYYGIT